MLNIFVRGDCQNTNSWFLLLKQSYSNSSLFFGLIKHSSKLKNPYDFKIGCACLKIILFVCKTLLQCSIKIYKI